MQTLYYVLLGLAVFIAVVFIGTVFLTGKGDAMSGGGSVRTTFKGRATFDDQMFKITVGLAGGFMVLMIVLDMIGNFVFP